MPATELYKRLKSPPGSAVTLLKQIFKLSAAFNKSLMVADDISSITYTVTVDETTGSPVTLTKTDVISDTAITGDAWTAENHATDQVGCCFHYDLPGSKIPDANKIYTIEFTVTPASGQAFKFGFIIETTDVG